MKKKLLLLMSFGAMMLLLTEANIAGMAQSGLIFLIGAIYILTRKKTNDIIFKLKMETKSFVMVLGLLIMGVLFCKRWSYSSMIVLIASSLHMKNKTLLIIVAFVLCVCSYYCISVVWEDLVSLWKKILECSWNKLPQHYQGICVFVVAMLTTNFLPQFMLGITTFEMGIFKFLIGSTIVFTLVLVLYALLGCYRVSVISAMLFFVGGGYSERVHIFLPWSYVRADGYFFGENSIECRRKL